MTFRKPARRCRHAAAIASMAATIASKAGAGVWGMDPVVGVDADYSTNPALLAGVPHTAETHGALLLDDPTAYNGNGFSVSVLPSFRLTDSSGYSSLASDYEHLTVKGEMDAERNTLTATAGIYQDSSLYQDYLSNGSTGVRRDSVTADVNWSRFLTERLQLDTDLNSSQVRYAEPAGAPTLTSYRNTSLSPTLSWNSSERNKLTFSPSVSLYTSLDGRSKSRSGNLQVGFQRQLTEIWTLTASAGYSRALDHIDFEEFLGYAVTPTGFVPVYVPLQIDSSQNGTVYTVNLTRKGELLTLNASASRQLTPSGFAYLSQQQSYELSANYTFTERLSFGADAHYLLALDPQLQGGGTDVRTLQYFTLSANWNLTEQWVATLSASRVSERYQYLGYGVDSNEVTITLSRHFNHIDLN